MASKGKRREPQRPTRRDKTLTSFDRGNDTPPTPQAPRARTPLAPKTAAQHAYITSMEVNRLTFALGPAGVGKTYIAARVAGELLDTKQIKKVYLTRPAVEAGGGLGFLPGELEDKMAPYIASYRRGFEDAMGGGAYEYHCRVGSIEIVPLEYMQGRSFDEPCMILFDEAENATPLQMKMFLTRLGENCFAVVDGDPQQKMISGQSGLIDGLEKCRYIKSVGVVEFGIEDIVRSGLVKDILLAYQAAGPASITSSSSEEGPDQFELPGFITGNRESA